MALVSARVWHWRMTRSRFESKMTGLNVDLDRGSEFQGLQPAVTQSMTIITTFACPKPIRFEDTVAEDSGEKRRSDARPPIAISSPP
jgi:hypothetical protein